MAESVYGKNDVKSEPHSPNPKLHISSRSSRSVSIQIVKLKQSVNS